MNLEDIDVNSVVPSPALFNNQTFSSSEDLLTLFSKIFEQKVDIMPKHRVSLKLRSVSFAI